MPHILIEFTAGLASDEQIEAMLDALHTMLKQSGLFDEHHIRLRATPLHFYRCGGGKAHFIHTQLRLHAGRTSEQKQQLSHALLATLQRLQWPVQDITVEVVEMVRDSYCKFSRH